MKHNKYIHSNKEYICKKKKITLPQKEIVKFLDTKNIEYNIKDNAITLGKINITIFDAIFEKTKNVALAYFKKNEIIVNEVGIEEAKDIINQSIKKEDI